MRAELLILLALTLTLNACGGDKDDTAADDTDADADADADGDADADADADSDTDADSDPEGCPDYSGFDHVGGVWSWSFTPEYASSIATDGTWTLTLTANDGGFDYVMAYAYENAGYSQTGTSTMFYTCDADGLWYQGSHNEYTTSAGGSTFDGWATQTLDAPALVLPHGITTGSTWTTAWVGSTETDLGSNTPFSQSVDYEITGEEEVTVPAGTYTALVVQTTTTVEGQDPIVSKSWADQDFGSVATETTELVGFAR